MKTFILTTSMLLHAIMAGPPSNKTGFPRYGKPPYTTSCAGIKRAYGDSGCCGVADLENVGFAPKIGDCKSALGHGIQVINTEFLHVNIGINPRVINTTGALDTFGIFFSQTFPAYLDTPLGEVIPMMFEADYFGWFLGPKEWRSNFMYLMESYTGATTKTHCVADWTNFTKMQECDPKAVESMLIEVAPTCDMMLANNLFSPFDAGVPLFNVIFDSFRFTNMVDISTCSASIDVPERNAYGLIKDPVTMVPKSIADVQAANALFNQNPSFDFRIVPPNGINRCMQLH